MSARNRIIVAPLNWGLGHASRCIPLVQHLQQLNHEVIIASDGAAFDFLQAEFPAWEMLRMPPLNMHYGSPFGLAFSILQQLPALNNYLQKEHALLGDYITSNPVDLIISDNRYGCYHPNVPSVLISHQLQLKTPIFKTGVNKYLSSLIQNFDECWVPDEFDHKLSGELSQMQGNTSVPLHCIGALSRFRQLNLPTVEQKQGRLLAILSGPEPHRTKFERKLIEAAPHLPGRLKLIRGVDQQFPEPDLRKWSNISVSNRMLSKELGKEMLRADTIICRSGYSSLMDLASLGRSALLVPTPAQTEQEYLAKYHHQKGHFFAVKEKELDLEKDLKRMKSGEYCPPELQLDAQKQREIIESRLANLC